MEQSLQVISRQERLEKWASRIMACRSSGMTIRAWSVSRQENPGQPAFAEITPPPKQTTAPAVTVRCSGMEADIYNGADAAVIETVLRILKSC